MQLSLQGLISGYDSLLKLHLEKKHLYDIQKYQFIYQNNGRLNTFYGQT